MGTSQRPVALSQELHPVMLREYSVEKEKEDYTKIPWS